jgi:endonuclease YncB( thermonuclease family)
VQLWYKESLIAEYSYLPVIPIKAPQVKIKTGNLLTGIALLEVIDGDTIKVRYQDKEQNVRFL